MSSCIFQINHNLASLILFHLYTYHSYSPKILHLLIKTSQVCPLDSSFKHTSAVQLQQKYVSPLNKHQVLSKLREHGVSHPSPWSTCMFCSFSHVLQVPRKDTAYRLTFRAENLKYHHLSHHPSASLLLAICFSYTPSVR